jgi:NitT/TauT family transport system ATP-binding protein
VSATIELANVHKIWGARQRGKATIIALAGISCRFEAGQFVVLLGPSGCGKSTLLRMIAGLDIPTSGEVSIDGRRIVGPGADRGMIFQDYALFPWRNVANNIAFGMEARGLARAYRRRIAQELIDLVGLSGFEDSYPSHLSGGMQQRVALARALANDPEVLLMDEPFSAVDSQTRELLQDELLRVWQVKRKTIVFVTHDITEAAYLADRVITISARPGQIRSEIKVDLGRPRDRTQAEFVKICKLLRQQLTPMATIAPSTCELGPDIPMRSG